MKYKTLLFILLLLLESCSQITPVQPEKPQEKKTEVISDTNDRPVEVTDKPDLQTQSVVQTLTTKNTEVVKKYCQKIDKYFKKYNWGKSNCEDFSWHHVRSSYWGNPIIWHVFGDESKQTSQNTTLIMCGVHGDEITPVKFCFDILEDLKHHPEILKDNLVIVAPLVAPDSFLKVKPTRTNARGVDVNRNFATKDWNKNALKLWKSRYRSDKRRFPGHKANSEQETIFQVNIIKRYNPNKILSVHAPLTLIDYDGPIIGQEHGETAHDLLVKMSDKAGKYKMYNYPFFTGSLGNWAGNERKIPTYTLELPNSDWNKTDRFFKTFQKAIHQAIIHDFITPKNTATEKVTDTKEHDELHDKVL